MPKIICLLTNEAMPNLLKIGFTDSDVEARMTDLSRAAGVPLPFEYYFAAEITDALPSTTDQNYPPCAPC